MEVRHHTFVRLCVSVYNIKLNAYNSKMYTVTLLSCVVAL